MFGPLNGVRIALVAAATFAALVAFVLGQFMVGAVLLVAVGVHGLGWLYLYRQKTGSTRRPLRQGGGH